MTQHNKERGKRTLSLGMWQRTAVGGGIGRGSWETWKEGKQAGENISELHCFLHNSGFCNWIFNEGELLVLSCPLTVNTVGSYQSLKLSVGLRWQSQDSTCDLDPLTCFFPSLLHLPTSVIVPTTLLGQIENLGVILDFSPSSSLLLPTRNTCSKTTSGILPHFKILPDPTCSYVLVPNLHPMTLLSNSLHPSHNFLLSVSQSLIYSHFRGSAPHKHSAWNILVQSFHGWLLHWLDSNFPFLKEFFFLTYYISKCNHKK